MRRTKYHIIPLFVTEFFNIMYRYITIFCIFISLFVTIEPKL
jgi:hypothetical protein